MQSTLPQPGASVWIRGQRWRVVGVRGDRTVARIDLTGDRGRQAYLVPFDRPVECADDLRPIRVRPQRARARLAYLIGQTFGQRTISTAVNARAAILPHQLEPVLAAVAGHRRILIADEVGLGKTIQAGLVAAEVVCRDPAARVLIAVPATLATQWLEEFRSRLRIACISVDRDAMDHRARERAFGDNPWSGSGVFLASLDYLKQRHVLDGIPPRPWDLFIVDEAHTACGHSDRHDAVRHLGQRSRRVVLLSATPHSGDEDRFTRLLDLGALRDDDLIVFRRRRADLGLTCPRRIAWHQVSLSEREQRVFGALQGFERLVLRAARRGDLDEARLLLAVLKKRALSTMAALDLSIDRRLAWLSSAAPSDPHDLWLQPSLQLGDRDEEEDIAGADDLLALRVRTGLDRQTEQSWLRRLSHLASAASGHESKVHRVRRLIARTSEPVIVFTEFRDSLQVLANHVRLIRPFSVLHGGMTDGERAEALERFQSGGADVLLATDVAGQGLNLQQRSRWVISLELPWNPVRLEQRIGRVDRIGQRRRVHFTLLVARHEGEAGVITRLAQRALIASRTLGRGSLIEIPVSEQDVRKAAINRTDVPANLHVRGLPLASAGWTRLARSAARHLESRRRFLGYWRGPEQFHRPVRTIRPRQPVRLVFSIPVLDGTGALVERRLVAVSAATAPTREIVAAAGRAAMAALEPRLRRLRRVATASLPANSALEHALAAVLASDQANELQPGLFDAAALRGFESDRQNADEVAHQLQIALDRLRLGCVIEAGQPVLEIVWGTRP